jgi:hypothetical protein
MSRRRVVGFYTDEKGKVRPLTEYGFEPPKKSMELKAVDTTPKHVLKERLRKYREEKGDISGPKPLFHYVPDEKQQTMEELTEKVSKQEKKKEEEKGKVKVKIKREHDGTYAVYNLTDPNDLIRMYRDYVEVLVALLGIYGFKKEDFDEETIRKLHYLDYGDTMTLSK